MERAQYQMTILLLLLLITTIIIMIIIINKIIIFTINVLILHSPASR